MNVRLLPVILWVAAVAGFAVMAAFASAHSYFPGDLWVSHRLQKIDSGAFDALVTAPETMAGMPLPGIIWLLALPLLWLTRHRGEALLFFFIAPTGWVLTEIVKAAVDRPRPSNALITIAGSQGEGHSFPSGHEMSAIVVFGGLLYFVAVLARPLLPRLGVQLLLLLAIVLTGVARIYHGDHWLSDVLGSALLGAIILSPFIAMDKVIAPRPLRAAAGRAPSLGRLT